MSDKGHMGSCVQALVIRAETPPEKGRKEKLEGERQISHRSKAGSLAEPWSNWNALSQALWNHRLELTELISASLTVSAGFSLQTSSLSLIISAWLSVELAAALMLQLS